MNWELPDQPHDQIEVWMNYCGEIFTIGWAGCSWAQQEFWSQLLVAMGGEFMGFL